MSLIAIILSSIVGGLLLLIWAGTRRAENYSLPEKAFVYIFLKVADALEKVFIPLLEKVLIPLFPAIKFIVGFILLAVLLNLCGGPFLPYRVQ